MSNLDSETETEFWTEEIKELSKFYVKVCEKTQTFQLEQLQLSVCSKACASNIREIMCCSCYFQKKFREKEGRKNMGDIAPDQFICAYCHVQANQRCTGCHETFYCSREHQKLHWRKHKNQCCAFKVSFAEKIS